MSPSVKLSAFYWLRYLKSAIAPSTRLMIPMTKDKSTLPSTDALNFHIDAKPYISHLASTVSISFCIPVVAWATVQECGRRSSFNSTLEQAKAAENEIRQLSAQIQQQC